VFQLMRLNRLPKKNLMIKESCLLIHIVLLYLPRRAFSLLYRAVLCSRECVSPVARLDVGFNSMRQAW